MSAQPPPLDGLSVLIVEDEFIIGMMLSNEITRAGGTPIGPVTSVGSALEQIESRIVHAAILDAKLIDGSGVVEVARCLRERRIPFVVFSGYDSATLPRELRDAPFVAKPMSVPLLIETIGRLRDRSTLADIAVPGGL